MSSNQCSETPTTPEKTSRADQEEFKNQDIGVQAAAEKSTPESNQKTSKCPIGRASMRLYALGSVDMALVLFYLSENALMWGLLAAFTLGLTHKVGAFKLPSCMASPVNQESLTSKVEEMFSWMSSKVQEFKNIIAWKDPMVSVKAAAVLYLVSMGIEWLGFFGFALAAAHVWGMYPILEEKMAEVVANMETDGKKQASKLYETLGAKMTAVCPAHWKKEMEKKSSLSFRDIVEFKCPGMTGAALLAVNLVLVATLYLDLVSTVLDMSCQLTILTIMVGFACEWAGWKMAMCPAMKDGLSLSSEVVEKVSKKVAKAVSTLQAVFMWEDFHTSSVVVVGVFLASFVLQVFSLSALLFLTLNGGFGVKYLLSQPEYKEKMEKMVEKGTSEAMRLKEQGLKKVKALLGRVEEKKEN